MLLCIYEDRFCLMWFIVKLESLEKLLKFWFGIINMVFVLVFNVVGVRLLF